MHIRSILAAFLVAHLPAQIPMRVADINQGSGSSNPAGLVDVSGVLYFSATRGVGHTLFAYDVAAGRLDEIRRFDGVGDGVGLGGKYYFSANDGVYGWELYVTDGKPRGTYRLTDLLPYRNSGEPSNLVVMGGKIYFAARGLDSSGQALGTELWVHYPNSDAHRA